MIGCFSLMLIIALVIVIYNAYAQFTGGNDGAGYAFVVAAVFIANLLFDMLFIHYKSEKIKESERKEYDEKNRQLESDLRKAKESLLKNIKMMQEKTLGMGAIPDIADLGTGYKIQIQRWNQADAKAKAKAEEKRKLDETLKDLSRNNERSLEQESKLFYEQLNKTFDYVEEVMHSTFDYKAAAEQIIGSKANEIKTIDRTILEFIFPDKEILSRSADEDFMKDCFENGAKLMEYHEFLYKRLKGINEFIDRAKYIQKQNIEDLVPYWAETLRNKIIADTVRKKLNFTEIYPAAAQIKASIETLYIEAQAKALDWGKNKERAEKILKIREIKKMAQRQLETAFEYKYQLEYLCAIFPDLNQYLDYSVDDLESANDSVIQNPEKDSVTDYLSREEYASLTETQRNQLALDRYIASRNKSKWQVGRDYEMYIGYLCETYLCDVEYSGIERQLEDLGRDLIAEDFSNIYIIQCKYWSRDKLIREKHIMQLYGTVMAYRITKKPKKPVVGVFVTSTGLSDVAKAFAKTLGIIVHEYVALGDFPRIKCNIGWDKERQCETHIYHLPMDLSYDVTKIEFPGECMAFTCAEAESKGFRRSYRWHGDS